VQVFPKLSFNGITFYESRKDFKKAVKDSSEKGDKISTFDNFILTKKDKTMFDQKNMNYYLEFCENPTKKDKLFGAVKQSPQFALLKQLDKEQGESPASIGSHDTVSYVKALMEIAKAKAFAEVAQEADKNMEIKVVKENREI